MIDQVDTSKTNQVGNAYVNPNGILGKDDFLKLLLVELQYQDPTEPMDSEKILNQTSQLATLESSKNTNKALEELAASFKASKQFSAISAIGKTANLGDNTIVHKEGEQTSFELYFRDDFQSGTITITDKDGNIVKTQTIQSDTKGVKSFSWDGLDDSGNIVKDGVYRVSATYIDTNGNDRLTQVGIYPIEGVRFENGEALVKLASNYVPLSSVYEVF